MSNLQLEEDAAPAGVGPNNPPETIDWPADLRDRAVVTPKRTAMLLDVSLPTVYELIKQGLLDTRHFGKRNTRITCPSIMRLLNRPGPGSGR